jgi:hypothetical protein
VASTKIDAQGDGDQSGESETRFAGWCVAQAMRSRGRVEDVLTIQHRPSRKWQVAVDEDPYVDEEHGPGLPEANRRMR